jgi:hypothetical protein
VTETITETDWRDDPAWVLVTYDPAHYAPEDLVKPPEKAELAQPPVWASLYDGRRIVATWWRPKAPSPPRATVDATTVVEKEPSAGT